MEIKAELNNATEEQRIDFVITYNHNQNYVIEEEIASEEEVVDEEGNVTKVCTYNLKALGYTEEELAERERQRIAMLSLTGADVERGIYKAKGMDFEDILEYLMVNPLDGLDVKALKIELKANNFYRGNPYVEAIGKFLGFTSEQLDKFFETNDYTVLLPVEVEDEGTNNTES